MKTYLPVSVSLMSSIVIHMLQVVAGQKLLAEHHLRKQNKKERNNNIKKLISVNKGGHSNWKQKLVYTYQPRNGNTWQNLRIQCYLYRENNFSDFCLFQHTKKFLDRDLTLKIFASMDKNIFSFQTKL